jgi:deoxyguanosine kinase
MNTTYNYICIEGNIGAGKTSLATRMAAQFNARFIPEEFEDNPFLPKFYQDADKYSFPLELSFLASRYQQLSDTLTHQELFHQFTISDYLIDKSLIFSRNTLGEDEYKLYTKLFHIMMQFIPRPDLLVYLYVDISKLRQNIRHRGREYEQNIKADYLERIQRSYLDHLRTLENQRILIIDTNNVDFVGNLTDYDTMVDLIMQDYPPGIHRIIP